MYLKNFSWIKKVIAKIDKDYRKKINNDPDCFCYYFS